jgi:hypothetical protein
MDKVQKYNSFNNSIMYTQLYCVSATSTAHTVCKVGNLNTTVSTWVNTFLTASGKNKRIKLQDVLIFIFIQSTVSFKDGVRMF